MRLSTYYLCSLLCLASFSQATAAPQTEQVAAKVAAAWLAATPNPLGAETGHPLRLLTGQTTGFRSSFGDVIFYVVPLQPEGFVVTAADSDVEPIIAFSATGSFVPSPQNPLFALLQRDIAERLRQAHRVQQLATPVVPSGQGKWARLAHDGPFPAGGEGILSVNDLRVAPFVSSQWGQSTAGGLACFNFYTPPYDAGNPENYVCGCANTAAAQIMRYYKHPTRGVGTNEFGISVDGVATKRRLRGGDGLGGPYAWNLMPLLPDAFTTETERQAIGALTADIGVAAGTAYAQEGSAASLTGETLKRVFLYSNVIVDAGLGERFVDQVHPNLDAKLPVYLWICADTGVGHAIICDGYGYNIGTLYYHLNLGWDGSYDAWYNLPNMHADGYQFTVVNRIYYNIYTNGTGEIISGRVVDVGNAPIPFPLVQAEGGGQKYSAQGDRGGIFAVPRLPSNTAFTLTVTKPGYQFAPRVVTTGCSQNYLNTGNRWALNFTGSQATNTRIISGYITNSLGAGVPGVQVRFSNGGGTLVTDESGLFFNTVAMGWSGTLTPAKSQCLFLPPSRSYSGLTTNLGDQDFLGSVVIRVNASATGANDGTSWTDAYTNLQTALSRATSGSELWVGEGVYYPGIERTNSFHTKAGVNLFGGFAGFETARSARDWTTHPTQLSGDVGIPTQESDNVYHVVKGVSGSLLDGFEVTGGHANGETWDDQCGGGIIGPYGVADFKVANCRIAGNSAIAGGGAYQSQLFNCMVTGNSADYQGGGAYEATLSNCSLTGNYADVGGGVAGSTLKNCRISDNAADWGGGAASSTLYNCTLLSNSADWAGGVYDSTLINCILYFNTAAYSPNYFHHPYCGVLTYSCTTPMPTNGVGNITNAPLFVDYAGGNLRLQSNSPCINAGRNACAPGPTDLDGLLRIVSGTVDVGAYEFQGPGSVISYAWLQHYGLPTDGSADATDSDADGHTTWQEWRCQTCPTNALSSLCLMTPSLVGSNLTVSWQSVAGVNYFLERSTNLSPAPLFKPLITGIPGQPGSTTYTDTNALGVGPFFYRVGVGPY